jgi:hypothetical protein
MTADTIICIFIFVIFLVTDTFTHLAILHGTILHAFKDLEVFVLCVFQLCKVLEN